MTKRTFGIGAKLALLAGVEGLRHALKLALEGLFESRDNPTLPLVRERPLVLLHGFASPSRVLLPLQRHLQYDLGRPAVRLSLGLGFGDIRRNAERVQRAIECMASASRFQHVDVVAHSLGGIVACYLLKCLDRGRRIRRVVTLGSPHCGVPSAFLGVLAFGALSRSMWQLIPGSRLLRELAALPVPQGSELVSIAGTGDPLVPVSCTELPLTAGHRHLVLEGADHWDLLFARPVRTKVSQSLEIAPAWAMHRRTRRGVEKTRARRAALVGASSWYRRAAVDQRASKVGRSVAVRSHVPVSRRGAQGTMSSLSAIRRQAVESPRVPDVGA